MEVRARRADFLAALYWTQSIVERRNTMPMLANVLVETGHGSVRVTATDLEVGVRGRLDAEVLTEGRVTLSAKKFYEIVREAPEETIQLKRLENEWVEIRSGRSVFKVVGLDAREFPQFPHIEGEKLAATPAGILKEMIEKTLFSVSIDETRYSLNGVFIEEREKGKARMVATDGHRLALVERDLGVLGLEKGVILPRKGLAELKKVLEASEDGVVAIGFKENMGLVVKEDVELFMRLIEGDFPDYNKVIPKDNPYVVKVEHEALLRSLRRVSILSSERYKGVKIDLKDGKLLISANNPDLGEAVEEIEVEYGGKPLTVGFNARYLMDVLGVFREGAEVELEVKDEVSPSVMRSAGDDGYLYVVMPMRL
ncbi:MAG: DNA polymerase III subunit beta [Deltaproteobacteria bacterium]|nr:DNA polymerase III subunit beta [Deltaproteobacteria bacterium]